MDIVVDLRRDWVGIMRSDLEKAGVGTNGLKSDNDVSLAFWNMHQRRIQTRARRVHVANEFTCPPSHVAAVDVLQKKMRRGEDLNRFRSSAALKPNSKWFDDRLLNDWGIQHLHLGPENAGQPLSGRTNECLYVYFTRSDAYCLAVLEHGHYHEKELMLRMHRNWPDVIAEHRATGVVVTDEDDLSDEDKNIRMLRGAGFTYLLTLDGVPYLSPGGGYAKSGNSVIALMRSNAAFTALKAWQERLEGEAEELVKSMKAEGFEVGNPPEFRLHVRNDWFCSAVEWTGRVGVDMGYLLGAQPT